MAKCQLCTLKETKKLMERVNGAMEILKRSYEDSERKGDVVLIEGIISSSNALLTEFEQEIQVHSDQTS